jgi:hypothetical protein
MCNEQSEVLWTGLPATVRERVDELVVQRKVIQAVLVVREFCRDAGAAPVPSLMACRVMLAERTEQLADRLAPLPPQDVDTLAAKAAELPRPPVAFEAVWDGDDHGWMVLLMAIMADPLQEVCLAWFRDGAETTTGRELARRFGVPFHFASPDEPDLDAPRWAPAR